MALAVAALVVAACGGDDDDDAQDSGESTEASAAPTDGASSATAGEGSTPATAGESSAAAPSEPIEGSIEYSFWGSPERAAKVDAIIDLFETQYPDASVSPEVADYASYIERFTVNAAGGGLPCSVGTQSTFYAPYAEQDVLMPLDDLIASGQIDTTNIPEDVLAGGQIDGVQYMIPTGTFVRIFGYNADLVEQAGAEPPTAVETWEDWATWLRELQPALPDGVYAASLGDGGTLFTLESWVRGHDVEVYTDDGLGFDKALLAEFWQYWLDLMEEGVAQPAESVAETPPSIELQPLALGDVVSATADIPHLFIIEQALEGAGLPSGIEWHSMPHQSPDISGNVLGANGISIANDCDEVATAAAWSDFFANDTEAAVAFQSDNGVVTNTEAQDALLADPETPEGVKQNVTVFRELTDAGDLTTTIYPAGRATLATELTRLFQELVFGQKSVDDAVDEFFASAEEALGAS
jgi:multiple sugar transport system substrate-binding protein